MTENDQSGAQEPLGYAGDIAPTEAWQVLADNPKAVLLDVRTPEEWTYVGLPNLDALHHEVCLVPWVFFPRMDLNPQFIEQLKASAHPDPDTSILILCRSGVRSVAAAKALTSSGFTDCYNILHGFEGNPDTNNQRGKISGWKVDGLAWRQK
ncbi:MAG: sulfurtransferase [Rhodospirillaceae bacterium]|nr:MAG: sulfurtransferase [Rhodospirillaceae bacterium]